MVGLVLNEGGYVTYPFNVFKPIEDYVKRLNWRITNAECGGDGSSYVFPFDRVEEYYTNGEDLFALLKEHPSIQWWWGSLSGFSKDISEEEIRKNPTVDLTMEQPYLENSLHHLEPKAILEVIAFDSTDTYVLADDPEVIKQLLTAFPNAESLDKYVFSKP